MLAIAIRHIEIEDEDAGETRSGWQLVNADGTGFGDVVRARDLAGYRHGHPVMGLHDTREEALAAAEEMLEQVARRHGGAFEVMPVAAEQED